MSAPMVEVNAHLVADPSEGRAVMVTPPVDEDFWLARVPVSRDQAIVCFPKFGTIGIGFQRETDWNTNLPYTCKAQEILNHIKHNKGCNARDAKCLLAIQMLQRWCQCYRDRQ